MKNKNLIKILLVVLAVVIAGVIYTLVTSSKKDDSVVIENESAESGEETLESTEAATGFIIAQTSALPEICVHVCGEVNAPGVYYLPEGSRIHEAVEKAGGFTEQADESVVNLASFITDGMQIYIPGKEEAEAQGLRPEGETDDGLVNINTADAAKLMTLPGIGEAKAEQIIAYRNENGSFETTEDIKNVSGIGESSYNKLKDLIKV